MADTGAPVVVPYDGTVVAVGLQDYGTTLVTGADALGYYVVISHGVLRPGQHPVLTRYAHLQRPSALRVGQRVQTGDLIGYVGRSGVAPSSRAQPLLYFQVLWDQGARRGYEGGIPLNPLTDFFAPLNVARVAEQDPGPPITPFVRTPAWGGTLQQEDVCGSMGSISPSSQQRRYSRYGSTQLSSRAPYPPARYDAPPSSGSGGMVALGAALLGGLWWMSRRT